MELSDKIQVFVGETGKKDFVKIIHELGWGRIWTEANPQVFPWEPWAFDNGAYSAYLNDQPFPLANFQRRVFNASRKTVKPQFAVLPDIVAGGIDSLYFSLSWRDRKFQESKNCLLPEEWSWFLAVQDGMEPLDVLQYMTRFDGIFLGGTSGYKARAAEWVQFAHDHGKPCHYARAGTPLKLDHAIESGADSLDSSTPLFEEKRFHHFVECWKHGNPQERLPLAT